MGSKVLYKVYPPTGNWRPHRTPLAEVQPENPVDTFVLRDTQPSDGIICAEPKNVGHGLAFNDAMDGTIEGTLIVTVAGTILKNKTIAGAVKVRAANVIMLNCEVLGPATANTELFLVDTSHSACRNFVGEFLTLIPRVKNSYINGAGRKDAVFRRCLIQSTVDGVGGFTSTTEAAAGSTVAQFEGCLIQKLAFFKPDIATPSHTDGTHNDGGQFQGGPGGSMIGCSLIGFFDTENGNPAEAPHPPKGNAAIQLNDNTMPVTGLVLEDNWISGWVSAINGFALSETTHSVSIKRNKIQNNQAIQQIEVWNSATGVVVPSSGPDRNVIVDSNWTPTGAFVTVVRH